MKTTIDPDVVRKAKEGMDFLEWYYPDKLMSVNENILSMRSPAHCVLGQMFFGYDAGLLTINREFDGTIFEDTPEGQSSWAAEHGFITDSTQSGWSRWNELEETYFEFQDRVQKARERREALWPQLDAVWKVLIIDFKLRKQGRAGGELYRNAADLRGGVE